MSKNTLLISVTALKERTAIHTNTDEKLLAPVIKYAQDIEIAQAIGSKLLKRLQEGIEAGDGAGALTADERDLLTDYIDDTLILFVMSELPVDLTYQFFTKGLIKRSAENVETTTMSEMIDVSQKFRARAEHYRERLIRYLRLNRDLFSSYLDCSDNDISAAKSGYSIQCYLPDDDCNCNEY